MRSWSRHEPTSHPPKLGSGLGLVIPPQQPAAYHRPARERRPMIVYHIRNWAKSFENNKSRVIGACRYVCMPNKQDGLGLLRILAQEDGAALFRVWCLILQACSRQVK